MRRAAWRIAVAAIAAVGAFLLGGLGLIRHPSSTSAAPAVGPRGAEPLGVSALLPGASLAQAIASLQERLHVEPADWRSLADLGLAYVQEARVTADPSYYPKAKGILARSLSLRPSANVGALTGMGALALARHDFAGALVWGERARAVDPYDPNVYGVIGDAQIELGRYPAAFATFQHMVDLRPALSSYARASYARELQGDVAGGLADMRMALSSAGTPEDAAWASFQVGELLFNSGRFDPAAASYRRAVQLDPNYVPPAAGLAKVAAAEGRTAEAIRRYRAAVARYPLPEYVIALGDLYVVAGRPDLAAQQYALVRVEQRLFQANGVNMDLEIALFDADHRVRLREGLAAARREWGRRQSILVADALAWELYANGRDAEALGYANRALALGTRSASLHFHRGMIELRLGMRSAARADLAEALSINPRFSILYAALARHTLAGLAG